MNFGYLGGGSSKQAWKIKYGEKLCAVLWPRGHGNIMRERDALRPHSASPYIVQLLAEFSLPRRALVVELAPHGSVIDLVDELAFEGRAGDFSIRHVDTIIQQVERGLDSLRVHGLRHNDLRACNVLVFEFDINPSRTRVKLGDLEDCAPGPRESTAALRAELLELR